MTPATFIESAKNCTDDISCMTWPFARDSGYGVLKLRGERKFAHRLTCEAVHGARPTPLHEVAHNCGNRACCNPQHLRWATRRENQLDRFTHGTASLGSKNGSAKLTEADVLQIRRMRPKWKETSAIGERYGVTGATIYRIARGESWGWL